MGCLAFKGPVTPMAAAARRSQNADRVLAQSIAVDPQPRLISGRRVTELCRWLPCAGWAAPESPPARARSRPLLAAGAAQAVALAAEGRKISARHEELVHCERHAEPRIAAADERLGDLMDTGEAIAAVVPRVERLGGVGEGGEVAVEEGLECIRAAGLVAAQVRGRGGTGHAQGSGRGERRACAAAMEAAAVRQRVRDRRGGAARPPRSEPVAWDGMISGWPLRARTEPPKGPTPSPGGR